MPVSGVGRVAIAGDGGNDAGLRGRAAGPADGGANPTADHANAVVGTIGYVHVARAIKYDTGGLEEVCLERWATVEYLLPDGEGSGHRNDTAGNQHPQPALAGAGN
jgi:hypothetical protein